MSNAILQGTISEATGGKFVNGAMSAAFRLAFNDFAMLNARSQACSNCASEAPSIFDEKGKEIFNHWMGGSGSEFIRNGEEWGNYLESDSYLSEDINNRLELDSLKRIDSGIINFKFHAELSSNGYFTGLGMLHGSHDDVGDFTLRGWANVNNGQVTYNVRATFNDIIDPNSKYPVESLASKILHAVGSPKNYTIRVNWNIKRTYNRRKDH